MPVYESFFVKIASVTRRVAGFSALSDKREGHNRDPVNKKRLRDIEEANGSVRLQTAVAFTGGESTASCCNFRKIY